MDSFASIYAPDPFAEFSVQGITLAVGSHQCIAIDGPCEGQVKVLSGRAWITVENRLPDMIAEPLDTIRLREGARVYVSGLIDVVNILVTVPSRFHNPSFALRTEGEARVLAVTTGDDGLVRRAIRNVRRWFANAVDPLLAPALRSNPDNCA